ncbi:MAG: hypothetical protein IPK86_04370 [Neisseriales bacterium]|nr:MAG: hypothetical protein IPK86_04370 [Neisseriales bacterium]
MKPMENWMDKINLIMIGVSLACLSGCASAGMQNQSSCPAYPHYTQEEWQKIEQSVTELPEQSPLIPTLQDYMDLLDKLEACQKIEIELFSKIGYRVSIVC